MAPMRDIPVKLRPLFLVFALASTLFVVYGSLVPFVLRPHSFAEALALFSDIRYLQLGASSRADLLANAIIYIPVSLFWMAVLAPDGRFRFKRAQVIIALAAMVALSVLVEFIQVYVAPRTVSKNDIISESVGIITGALVWAFWGSWLSQGIQRLLLKGRISCDSLLLFFALAVLGYSLLPFDFFISAGEIKQAIQQRGMPLLGTFSSSDSFGMSAREVLIGCLEFSIATALGFVTYHTNIAKRFARGQIVLLAFLLFAFIEVLQFFEYSGNSTLTSALVKTGGVYVGLHLAGLLTHQTFLDCLRIYRDRFPFVWPAYMALALFIKGWSLMPAFDLPAIAHIMSEMSFIPFYYHYFTTEMAAFKSALLQVALISPLTLFWWSIDKTAIANHLLIPTQQWKRLPKRMWLGALLALGVEVGGLLWASLRPDLTNILIIAMAIPFIYGFLELMYRSVYRVDSKVFQFTGRTLTRETSSTHEDPYHFANNSVISGWRAYIPNFSQASLGRISFAMVAWGAAGIYCINYPVSPVLLCLFGLAYIAVLQRSPMMALVVIPAGIPLLDWYPMSGRFFLTELDFIILLTLGSQYLAGHYDVNIVRKNRPLWLLVIITSLVYVVSVVHALWGHTLWDNNATTSFYSPVNAVRLSKAWIWFVLLLPVIAFFFKHNQKSFLRFTQGMLLGLAGLLLAVIAERYLFTGLFDFETVMHRVRGSFATMHTGGGHIDIFLITTIPFLLYPFITRAGYRMRLLALCVLLVALYGVFVTYSRGPYLVASLVGCVMLASYMLAVRKHVSVRWVAGISVLVFSLAASWVAIPFVFDSFLTQRLSIATQDKDTRVNQWARVANLVNGSAMSYAFGNGPGTLPRSIMLDNINTDMPNAMHDLITNEDNTFLALSAGRSLFTNQYVSVEQDKRYEYHFRYRSPEARALLRFSLCEKWIDDSFRCQETATELPPSNEWKSATYSVLIDAFPAVPLRDSAISMRPKTLGISVAGQTRMLLDDLELLDMSGRSLLKNGNFSAGNDFWFITSDNHLDWHAKNLIVNIYHDQGIAGVLSFAAFIAFSLWVLLKQLLNHNRHAVIMLGALSGYLGVGMVASAFEVPQLALLLYLLLAVIHTLPLMPSASKEASGSIS